MSEVPEKNIFEGAGFLLSYKSNFVLAARIKKQGDVDPIEEVEYMGGKPEGAETPHETAYNELVEECGGEFLDADWPTRCTELHTFQPFSKKWIWCFQLELTDAEFERLIDLDAKLDSWSVDKTCDFSAITKRAPAEGEEAGTRKAVQGLLVASKRDVVKYLLDFCNIPASANRMKDAKAYGTREDILFTCSRIIRSDVHYRRRLRGFNLVMFETHKDYLQKMATEGPVGRPF